MALSIDRDFKNKKKEIKYLNKDFSAFRQNLIELAKVYFPDSYKDFNETSPGMMFIEQASYVGDVLSFYLDNQLKESLLPYATERKNVLALANFLGYKPKSTTPAVTTIDVYQVIPSKGVGASNEPDYKYSLRIREGMEITSNEDSSITFRTTDLVDFNDTNDTEITVYERNATTGEPTFYLLKKQVQAVAGTTKTVSKTFSEPTQFDTLSIADTDVISIINVRDSNNNKWYEVPYLAQDTVAVSVPNTIEYNPELAQFRDTVPYLLKLIRTPKRFTTRVLTDNSLQLEFGAGVSSDDDELIIPNPSNTAVSINTPLDPNNFLQTKTYGQVPANTTLTVTYTTGGGVNTNVAAGSLTKITLIEFEDDELSLSVTERNLLAELKASVAVTNEEPATGGRGAESVEEIRRNALAYFGAQNRAVTSKDYNIRVLSMPARYGNVAKAYVVSDGTLDANNVESLFGNKVGSTEKNNPFAINLYVLGYDSNNNLTTLNAAIKENIRTYLGEYRILTDGINVLDGFIINIGIDFQIIVFPDYNKKEVLIDCIEELKEMFDINKRQFNEPINLSEVELTIANVEGVASVPKVEIVNKCGGEYSSHAYNITEATKDKIIYPSLDPSIFEIKFPTKDIRGRAL